MHYKYEELESTLIIYLEGQLIGSEEVNKLSDFFNNIKDKDKIKGKDKIIIDLAAVPFISSLVVGLFIKFHKAMFDDNIKLALINANSTISEIFKITRVDLSLNIFPTLQEAVDYLET